MSQDTPPLYYNYHPKTGEYLGQARADKDPLEKGKYLLPANATLTQPPQSSKNEVAVFDGSVWHKKPDFRGQTVKILDDDILIKQIGVTPESLQPSEIELKRASLQKSISQIKIQLNEVDIASIRPLREGETNRLAELALKAENLRSEYRSLNAELEALDG